MNNDIQEEFTRLVQKHDITFEFSDDHLVWRKGDNELKQIKELKKQLPENIANKIWNDNINEKIPTTHHRKLFYWHEHD